MQVTSITCSALRIGLMLPQVDPLMSMMTVKPRVLEASVGIPAKYERMREASSVFKHSNSDLAANSNRGPPRRSLYDRRGEVISG